MKNLFLCYPKFNIEDKDDIRMVWAKDEDDCLDLIAKDLFNDDDYIRDYVEDISSNEGILDTFRFDEDDHLFGYVGDRIYPNKYLLHEMDLEEAIKYVNEKVNENMREFFMQGKYHNDESLYKIFQSYIHGEIKNMPDEIFQYVIRYDPHYFPYEVYPVNHSEPNQSMIII